MAPSGLSSSQTPTVNMYPLHQAILLPLSGVSQMESPGGYPPSASPKNSSTRSGQKDRAGHKQKLAYKVETDPMENKCPQRSRNFIWFNPHCSSNIRTKKFVSLVREHLPKSSPLSIIFNSKKLKVSYKTNICCLIKSHNKKILSGRVEIHARSGCNYRGGVYVCPMRGSCP